MATREPNRPTHRNIAPASYDSSTSHGADSQMNTNDMKTRLDDARRDKKDEFYTQLTDIEHELKNYKGQFEGKVVYCNCDDPRVSNFFHYFSYNFEKLGLKKLITTCFRSQQADLFSQNDSDQAIYLEYQGDSNGNNVPDPEEIGIKPLSGDGDFRSPEALELLKQADIVVTNPPFSLFREHLAQLIEYDKKFLIVGNQTALSYKEVFSLVRDNKVWLGPSITSGDREFQVPDGYPLNAASSRVDEQGNKYLRIKGVRWFTNMDHARRHEDMVLYKPYSPDENPKYTNGDAISVGKTSDIPMDYDGPMGVPLTFMDKYNPDQFEILGSSIDLSKQISTIAEKGTYSQGGPAFYLPKGDGTYRRLFFRIVIRNRRL